MAILGPGSLLRYLHGPGRANEHADPHLVAVRHAGVLVHRRESTKTAGEITGYTVALPQRATGSGGVVWFGGGKLAPDLTLPKPRRRWDERPASRAVPEPATGSATARGSSAPSAGVPVP